MGKPKKISISALNIKTQPHSPERYVELFLDAFNLKRRVNMRGDYYGILGYRFFLNNDDPLEGITGNINRYLEIDPNKPWLNVQETKAAEEDDIAEINIPEHLKPNMAAFRFVFFPVGHRLFFETYSDQNSLGPSTVLNFFQRLFAHETIIKKYGDVTVVQEPARETLDDILAIHSLTTLEMKITRPNPDDPFESFEHKFYKRMLDENADIYETTLKGKDLSPSETTKMMARIASSNGQVYGKGKDSDGKIVEELTVDHPLYDAVHYNPDLEDPREVFVYKAARMLEDILDWLKGK